MTLRPEVAPRGRGLIGRAWDTVKNVLLGRRLVDCSRCSGTGIMAVQRLDWDRPASESRCVLTVCNKCEGVGALWC